MNYTYCGAYSKYTFSIEYQTTILNVVQEKWYYVYLMIVQKIYDLENRIHTIHLFS